MTKWKKIAMVEGVTDVFEVYRIYFKESEESSTSNHEISFFFFQI